MQSWTTEAPAALTPDENLRLRIFDTQSGEVVEQRLNDGVASLYVCGITPYDSTHLGHANTYVSFDLLNRLWRAQGYQVSYTQNVTDIDDPLLERAQDTGVDWRGLADEQIALFCEDMQALNVLAPDHYLGAVETIPWVVEEVTALEKAGVAYRLAVEEQQLSGEDIYFDIQAAEQQSSWRLGQYCRLSTADMERIFPERGGDPQREGKRHRLDPLLWRAARPGEPSWDGGCLGPGRPGWHIECSAIARKTLPAPFTVQGGGSDLCYPHHEYSAAHAQAATDTALAEHFVHAGMVGLDGEKMSKSRGNLIFVSQLRQAGENPAAIRTLLLSQHYRRDWFYRPSLLEEATARLATWREALHYERPGDAGVLAHQIRTCLADDLNAPEALRCLDEWAATAKARETTENTEQGLDVAAVVDALTGIQLLAPSR